MGVADLPPEPFSDKQQRQSRMDGGVDEADSLREEAPQAPPIVHPMIEKERNRAARVTLRHGMVLPAVFLSLRAAPAMLLSLLAALESLRLVKPVHTQQS